MSPPFFTIGIPTYNRHEMLKDALVSVITQSFTDFEIIVGNDYTDEVLTSDLLGISDPRIRIVNYPSNLREVGNMNALLEMASGAYFTWLYDDDLYEPDFLQTAHDCLVQTGFPPALFPSFRMMRAQEIFKPRKLTVGNLIEFTGREFLNWYSADSPQIASTFGLFDTCKLRSTVGNVESLSPSTIGLYSEFHYLVKCALFDRIVFIDAPFYVFRRHAESYSESNLDLENHMVAGQNLILKSAEVLRHPSLMADFTDNLLKICIIHIITFAYKAARVEFARKAFGLGTFPRALTLHIKEFRAVRAIFTELGGIATIKTRWLFLKILCFCQYLMVRHLLHFYNRSLR